MRFVFVPLHSQARDLITGLQAGMQIQTLMQEGIREAKNGKKLQIWGMFVLIRRYKMSLL